MEWLLIINLGIVGVESPPPVAYTYENECVEAAKKIAGDYNWIHYMEIGPNTLKVEPGVFRPTVHCEPAEWKKNPPGSK